MASAQEILNLLPKTVQWRIVRETCEEDQTGIFEKMVRLLYKHGMPLESIVPFLIDFAKVMQGVPIVDPDILKEQLERGEFCDTGRTEETEQTT